MPHIGFPDLIQHALDMVALSPHQCRQIQVIAVCDGVFSDGKPVVIVIFQDPLCLLGPVSQTIDIRLVKLIHLA